MTRFPAIALPLAVLLAGCQTTDEMPTERLGQATLRLANGLPGGTVQLLASGSQVHVSIALVGVSQGTHGVHLHMVGACEAPGFESAGGHLNPEMRQHGMQNPAGPHREFWQHVTGCRQWLVVERDTRNHAIASVSFARKNRA